MKEKMVTEKGHQLNLDLKIVSILVGSSTPVIMILKNITAFQMERRFGVCCGGLLCGYHTHGQGCLEESRYEMIAR